MSPDLRQRFLAGMSQAACTVNVVTTDGPAGRFGLTISAMASVSADTVEDITIAGIGSPLIYANHAYGRMAACA